MNAVCFTPLGYRLTCDLSAIAQLASPASSPSNGSYLNDGASSVSKQQHRGGVNSRTKQKQQKSGRTASSQATRPYVPSTLTLSFSVYSDGVDASTSTASSTTAPSAPTSTTSTKVRTLCLLIGRDLIVRGVRLTSAKGQPACKFYSLPAVAAASEKTNKNTYIPDNSNTKHCSAEASDKRPRMSSANKEHKKPTTAQVATASSGASVTPSDDWVPGTADAFPLWQHDVNAADVLLRLAIDLPRPIGPGYHVLAVDYAFPLRDDGLGVSSYGGAGGNNRSVGKVGKSSTTVSANQDGASVGTQLLLVSTHLEPIFAPLWFPCASVHNAVRVPMQLSLRFPMSSNNSAAAVCKPKTYNGTTMFNVLSNAPLLRRHEILAGSGGIVEYEFEETTALPAYLYAFAAGSWASQQFDVRDIASDLFSCADGHIAVHVPAGDSLLFTESQTMFVLAAIGNAAVASLRILSKRLGIEGLILMPKLDIVCLPEMVLAGMEHHGCIFIYTPAGTDPLRGKEALSDVLHEVAHLWVGNSVGLSLGAKEGLVQAVEAALSEDLFGKQTPTNAAPPAAKGKGVKPGCASLTQKFVSKELEAFHACMNPDTYRQFAEQVRNSITGQVTSAGDGGGSDLASRELQEFHSRLWSGISALLVTHTGRYASNHDVVATLGKP